MGFVNINGVSLGQNNTKMQNAGREMKEYGVKIFALLDTRLSTHRQSELVRKESWKIYFAAAQAIGKELQCMSIQGRI